jgi:flagellar basal body P-ring protein FlgI
VLVGLVDNILAAAGIIVGDRQGAGDAQIRYYVTTSKMREMLQVVSVAAVELASR